MNATLRDSFTMTILCNSYVWLVWPHNDNTWQPRHLNRVTKNVHLSLLGISRIAGSGAEWASRTWRTCEVWIDIKSAKPPAQGSLSSAQAKSRHCYSSASPSQPHSGWSEWCQCHPGEWSSWGCPERKLKICFIVDRCSPQCQKLQCSCPPP